MGMATLAELLEQGEEPGHLAAAHAAAVAGRDAWPGSPGGERCKAIAERIELPVFQLQSMRSDGIGRRSLQVSHKNLPAVYLRAYPADLLGTDTRFGGRPFEEAARALIRDGRPVAAWRIELPATPDFDLHVTWIVPPLDRPGAYVLVASSQEDFASPEGRLAAVRIILTDLVLLGGEIGGGKAEVLALSGATGEPLAGAEVRLLEMGNSPKAPGPGITGADGAVRFPVEPGGGYRVLGSSAGGPAELEGVFISRPDPPAAVSTLIYTDRAVYRPQQTLFWKVLAYKETGEGPGALPGQTVTVTLYDPNRQEVASRAVTTNGFGTAAGEFQIPAGRPLGEWRLGTSETESWSSSAWIRVEEYKRPTFEVVLDDPAAPLRLGAPAKLTGRAVYYFGLPVTHGQARWRITRTPVYPWWQRESGYAGGRIVAAGTSAPDADGKIEIAFTPRPEARGARRGRGVDRERPRLPARRPAGQPHRDPPGPERRAAAGRLLLGALRAAPARAAPAARRRAGAGDSRHIRGRRLPHSGRRPQPPVGGASDAGAHPARLARGAAARRRPSASRRGRRGRGEAPAAAAGRLPAGLGDPGRSGGAGRGAAGADRRRAADPSRPAGGAQGGERDGARGRHRPAAGPYGLPRPELLPRGLARRRAPRAAHVARRRVALGDRAAHRPGGPRRPRLQAPAAARPPALRSHRGGAGALGRPRAAGGARHLPRPAPPRRAGDLEGHRPPAGRRGPRGRCRRGAGGHDRPQPGALQASRIPRPAPALPRPFPGPRAGREPRDVERDLVGVEDLPLLRAAGAGGGPAARPGPHPGADVHRPPDRGRRPGAGDDRRDGVRSPIRGESGLLLDHHGHEAR
ncbi:MAG: hypothetical protein DMF53_06490 [Acidobacteria bacterium]|nr:MAG: hypothetical protein DMF53_06490 [Acidobacteriota bacterium]